MGDFLILKFIQILNLNIMKYTYIIFTSVLLLTSGFSFAQSVGDLINQTQDQRNKQLFDKDQRKLSVGFYADYVTPNEQSAGKAAFTTGFVFGLKVLMPVFTSGDGSNIGNTDGDLTFSAGWTDMLSNSVNTNYPDWNTYSGMVGLKIGFGGLLFVEPQAGYAYGTYSNNYLKVASSQVSGFSYAARAGFTLLKGFDIYGVAQAIQTKEFGSPIDYGFGFAVHF
ncbi:MAG: hypothetical protein ACHQF4_09810 [Sphingobacteriales bacterium]